MKSNTTKYIILVLLLIIGTVVYSYNKGYFDSSDNGSISVVVPEDQAIVFVDGELVTPSTTEGQTIKVAEDGVHGVIIAKENFWPWAKEDFSTAQDTTLTAFFIPRNPTTTPVLFPNSAEYRTYFDLINNTPAPSETNKLISADGTVAVWTNGGAIFAEWQGEGETPTYFCDNGNCDNPITILTPKDIVRNLFFYQERNDVVLFGTTEGIYALEINKEGTQNFQPVYQGTDIYFYKANSDLLYIMEAGDIFTLSF